MSAQCKIALFYRYVHIEDVKISRDWFEHVCRCQNLQGRILIASEGINGTVAGLPQQVDEFVNVVSTDVRFQHIDWKFSLEQRDKLPFPDLHIRESPEIVSSGRDGISPQNVKFSEDSFGGLSNAGIHLSPDEFHSKILESQENSLLLDVRNQYEYDIGTVFEILVAN